MKKSLLFSFMVAGLVMMSSCTKEKVIVVGGDDSNAAQQIVLQVANTGCRLVPAVRFIALRLNRLLRM